MKLKWEDHGLKTPLARARGLGSSHSGAGHWMHQRITALANIPLMLWLVWSMVSIHDLSYASFISWQAEPVNAILMILAIMSVFYHASLGAQVIVEDYVHNEGCKIVKLMGIKLFYTAGAVACIFSILKIAFAA